MLKQEPNFILVSHSNFSDICDYAAQTLAALQKQTQVVVYFPQQRTVLPSWIQMALRHNKEHSHPTSLPRIKLFSLRYHPRLISTIELCITQLLFKLFFPHHIFWIQDVRDGQWLQKNLIHHPFIFDIVDDAQALPDLSLAKAQRTFTWLIKNSLRSVCISPVLQKKYAHLHPIQLVPMGLDERFLHQKPSACTSKVVCLTGAINARIDLDWLKEFVHHLPPGWKLWIIGPIVEFWNRERINRQKLTQVLTLPQVLYTSQQKKTELVAMLRKASVGLIPYRSRAPFNQTAVPMKLGEYLAMGLYVVGTPLQSVEKLGYPLHSFDSGKVAAQTLSSLVTKHTLKTSVKQRDMLKQQTWDKKVQAILRDLH